MSYRNVQSGGNIVTCVTCHVEGCREPGPYTIVDEWPYCRKHVDRARRAAEPDNRGSRRPLGWRSGGGRRRRIPEPPPPPEPSQRERLQALGVRFNIEQVRKHLGVGTKRR